MNVLEGCTSFKAFINYKSNFNRLRVFSYKIYTINYFVKSKRKIISYLIEKILIGFEVRN